MYYDGFYEVCVGFLSLGVSFFRKNNKSEQASFIRRYNKQILVVFGIVMLVVGSVKFLR